MIKKLLLFVPQLDIWWSTFSKKQMILLQSLSWWWMLCIWLATISFSFRDAEVGSPHNMTSHLGYSLWYSCPKSSMSSLLSWVLTDLCTWWCYIGRRGLMPLVSSPCWSYLINPSHVQKCLFLCVRSLSESQTTCTKLKTNTSNWDIQSNHGTCMHPIIQLDFHRNVCKLGIGLITLQM